MNTYSYTPTCNGVCDPAACDCTNTKFASRAHRMRILHMLLLLLHVHWISGKRDCQLQAFAVPCSATEARERPRVPVTACVFNMTLRPTLDAESIASVAPCPRRMAPTAVTPHTSSPLTWGGSESIVSTISSSGPNYFYRPPTSLPLPNLQPLPLQLLQSVGSSEADSMAMTCSSDAPHAHGYIAQRVYGRCAVELAPTATPQLAICPGAYDRQIGPSAVPHAGDSTHCRVTDMPSYVAHLLVMRGMSCTSLPNTCLKADVNVS